MEAIRQELIDSGRDIHIVAVNTIGGESTEGLLAAECSFDLLQDVPEVSAWTLMGGHKDDMFIYREGGALAPGGYLPIGGEVNTVLSTTDGYANVRDAIIEADDLGPGPSCDGPPAGLQLPGNVNQDGGVDISDAIFMLLALFGRAPAPMPCGGDSPSAGGDRALFDLNGDGAADISDAVHLLEFLFSDGPPPDAGLECVPIGGCPDACPG